MCQNQPGTALNYVPKVPVLEPLRSYPKVPFDGLRGLDGVLDGPTGRGIRKARKVDIQAQLKSLSRQRDQKQQCLVSRSRVHKSP